MRPLWLLLLPCPPRGVTFKGIKSLYASVITLVLRKAADISSSFSATLILDVAIPYPAIGNSRPFPYSDLQNLLSRVYTLICMLCTEYSIDVQYGNDVDVRVLLIKDPIRDGSDGSKSTVDDGAHVGSFTSLQQLACCGRPWQRVCTMEREESEILLQLFLRLRNPSVNSDRSGMIIERFPTAGTFPTDIDVSLPQTHEEGSRVHHSSVAVGGTFDHLHSGHKLLLSTTASVLDQTEGPKSGSNPTITVGITGDELLINKKFREHLEGWNQRQAAVQSFLLAFLGFNAPSKQNCSIHEVEEGRQQRTVYNLLPSGVAIRYVEIFDACGPTITDESISALVLSGETRAGGKAVNEKRAEKGWAPLDIFEVDVLDPSPEGGDTAKQQSQEFQNKISSTQIRQRIEKRSRTAD
ncbi:MAG: hypothetical protein Q9218_003959 [Villophora microphyllina]